MHFTDLFQKERATYSFEFFPPRSADGYEPLFQSVAELEQLKPSFVSVTYGAGGSTRERTHELVVRIKRETPLRPVPHLTCVGHTEREILGILERYAGAGIGNIMALRGDDPADGSGNTGDLAHAADLVGLIARFNSAGGHPNRRGFGIAVAGYPEGHAGTPNRLLELEHLKAKVDRGANVIVTQLFFDNRDFYDFRDRCRLAGIRVPIVAGVMPITSLAGMRRMAELALGARFPAPLIRALNRADSDAESVRRVGVHWATEQCRDLIDHEADGIHFYTLNKSTATREIYKTLGVRDSRALR